MPTSAKVLYDQALEAATNVSAAGQQDAGFLALLGDIHAHLGNTAKAEEIFRDAIGRNPDNDQSYLSLTLVQLRNRDVNGAEKHCRKGLLEFRALGKFCGVWELFRLLKAKQRKLRERSNALWSSYPNGPELLNAGRLLLPDRTN